MFEIVAQSIILGIMRGALYGLAAVGFSLVFGVTKILNIAHGSLLMLGGYAAFILFSLYMIDPFASLLPAALIISLISVAIYKTVFSPVIKLPEESKISTSLLVAFGLILILDNAAILLFTADERSITPQYVGLGFKAFNLTFPYIGLGDVAIALIAVFGLHFFLHRTYLGKSIRATAEDWQGAVLMGINIDRAYLVSFILGTALAAIAGALIAVSYSISPHMGMEWTLRAMIIMVLAGIGSIRGVFVAGILLGIVEAISAIYIGPYMLVIGLVAFLLILVFRPRGLFGRA